MIAGLLLRVAVLWSLGLLVLLIGAELFVLGVIGHAIGGRLGVSNRPLERDSASCARGVDCFFDRDRLLQPDFDALSDRS